MPATPDLAQHFRRSNKYGEELRPERRHTLKPNTLQQRSSHGNWLRHCRSSIHGNHKSVPTPVRRAKSTDVLQVFESSQANPVLVRDNHNCLSTIQYLRPTQTLLILTPPGFSADLTTAFKVALLSNYSKPPTLAQLPYGKTDTNNIAETSMGSVAKTIIFVSDVNSAQRTLIEKTVDKRPLLIIISYPSSIYLRFIMDTHLSACLVTLMQGSVKGLQNIAALIQEKLDSKKGESEGELRVSHSNFRI